MTDDSSTITTDPRDLDKRIARQVFGHVAPSRVALREVLGLDFGDGEPVVIYRAEHGSLVFKKLPYYRCDVNLGIDIIGRLRQHGFFAQITDMKLMDRDEWSVQFGNLGHEGPEAVASTLSEAICMAALALIDSIGQTNWDLIAGIERRVRLNDA